MFPLDPRALLTLFLHLEQMEKAGVPVRKALETARDDADSKRLSRILAMIAEEVKAGRTLSEALGAYPHLFDAAMIRLIAAGEKSGKLAKVFESCRAHIANRTEHARKMKKAMMYPKISGAIILALAAFRGQDGFAWVAAALIGTWFLFSLGRRFSPLFKQATDRVLLMIPVIGPLVMADSWARYASALALLFEAGIPLKQAVETAAACMPNLALQGAALEIAPMLAAGSSLAAAFAKTPYMERMTLTMVKAGENSGNLAHTLREVASWHDSRTDAALTALHQYAGPALTLVLGWIVYAVFARGA